MEEDEPMFEDGIVYEICKAFFDFVEELTMPYSVEDIDFIVDNIGFIL